MKKFYALALSALVAVSANAASPKMALMDGEPLKMPSKIELKHNAQNALENVKSNLNNTAASPAKAKAAASFTEADLSGEYNIMLGDYYFQNSVGAFSSTATVSVEEGFVFIESDGLTTEVLAVPNSTFTAIQFVPFELGKYNLNTSSGVVQKYVKFLPYIYDADNGIVPQVLEVAFTGYAFAFPADYGFAWAAYDDEDCTSLFGYLGIYDVLSLEKSDTWSEPVTASYIDNILAPGFGVTLTEPSDVKVYKHNYESDYYMIEEPWVGLYTQKGFKSASPSIYLDATDPTNVLMELSSTNINGGTTEGVYYVLSRSFNDYLGNPTTADQYKITYTEANNKGTFHFPAGSCLLYASTAQALYTLGKEPTTITFDLPKSNGIADAMVEDANAPVKYYNLQGVEVANPAAGQLVIRKQGNKAEKVVIR